MRKVLSRDGDTVPLVLWLSLGRSDDEVEEEFYRLNPGVESYGPVLPKGVELKLPDSVRVEPAKVVNVWD
mgnify:CR=1 FL=1